MKIFYLGSFLISFLIVLATVPFIRRLALRIGFMDVPTVRKIHINPIPLGGGVGVFIAFIVVAGIIGGVSGFAGYQPAIGIIVGISLIVLIGLYDDYFEMDAQVKLLGQFIAAIVFLAFIKDVSPIMQMPAYPIFVVLWIVSLQNALNFLDNMDGLCGGLSMMIAAGFGILFVLKGMPLYAILSFSLAGAATGFLKYNLPPARIFLGDTGSLLFGYSLACLGIVHFNSSPTFAEALAPVLIMAYPLFDLTFVVITRLNEGRKVYIGGKDHSSHRLSYLGFSKRATVFLIYIINLLLVISGVIIYFLIESPFRILLVVVFALSLAFVGSHLYKNILYLKFRILAVFLDIASINLGFVAYCLIRYYSGLMAYSTILPLYTVVVPLIWINIFWLVLYSATGLYDLPFESDYGKHVIALIKSLLAGVAIFLVVNFNPDSGFLISVKSVVIYVIFVMILGLISRFFLVKFLHSRIESGNRRINCMVVGLNNIDQAVGPVSVIGDRYNVVGYAGEGAYKTLKRLGDRDKLHDLLREYKTARVFLDLADSNYNDLRDVFDSAFYMETQYLIAGPLGDNLKGLNIQKSSIENVFILSLKYRKIFMRLIKRAIDVLVAAVILLISSPIFLCHLLAAKLKRHRYLRKDNLYGVHGRAIPNYSFYSNHNTNGISLNKQLRLPAFLTVFKGGLSLVGTVPLPPSEAVADSRKYPGYWRRELIKPGIWGPAHFSKREEYFENELKYMQNMSILSDIYWIVFGVVKTVFLSGKRKYAGSEAN